MGRVDGRVPGWERVGYELGLAAGCTGSVQAVLRAGMRCEPRMGR